MTNGSKRGLLIGLTGGIGSGKSAAADRFAELGAAVIDADVIAHELTRADGAAMPAIKQAFGAEVLAADGALDRAAMRRQVFADPARRTQLESILHPLIRATSEARRDAAWTSKAHYVVMVIPLLVEAENIPTRRVSARNRDRFDRVLVIDCPEHLQVARVMARNGLAEIEVRAIMAAQASRQQRLDAADDVIVNDGDLDSLRARAAALHVTYCVLADEIRIGG